MNTHSSTTPSAGAWPWLMQEARSALPTAPVVQHVERPPRTRTSVARVLRAAADRLEPAPVARPAGDAFPC